MNRHRNASMHLNASGVGKGAQLGWGGYLRPTRWDSTNSQLCSVIVPFQYDPSQKDTYYSKPDPKLQQKSFGCFGRSSDGYIILYPTTTNGCGSSLFDMLFAGSETGDKIEQERKCGYDIHFSAVGNAWCLPLSGHTTVGVGYGGDEGGLGNDSEFFVGLTEISRTSSARCIGNYKVQTMNLKNKIYLGADSPRMNWDGTHFGLSDLHTAMNRGNNHKSQSPFYAIGTTDNFDDLVYKINPREQWEDWTPARKPYEDTKTYFYTDSNGSTKSTASTVLNENLEPWTIYDSLTGITIEDFALSETQWKGTMWDLLGFSYKQFHNSVNTRLSRIDYTNSNNLSIVTTNSEISEGDTKIYHQNLFAVPMMKNMINLQCMIQTKPAGQPLAPKLSYYPEIIQKTESIKLIADNLPTRMIRGYYTIRSNIISETPFIGGKKNNTMMPIVAIVDKINGDGDFYFQQESSLIHTITKPLKLASVSCMICDPDGSYANVSEQSTILFKIQRNRNVTFNVAEELLQEQQSQKK